MCSFINRVGHLHTSIFATLLKKTFGRRTLRLYSPSFWKFILDPFYFNIPTVSRSETDPECHGGARFFFVQTDLH